MRILCICLFIAVAGLAFAAVIFLSGSFISTDEPDNANTTWKASASCSEITETAPLF